VLWPEPSRFKRILGLAAPIIGAMVSQNALNLVDTALVGHLGDDSIAAVSLGNFVTFATMAFVTGLSAGVQAMVARRRGEGAESETAIPLNGGLLMAMGFAIPLAIGMYFLAEVALPHIAPSPEVARMGVAFVQVRLLAVPGIGMNFAFRGYWSAVDLAWRYLMTLLVMHAVNLVLDLLLIYGLLGAPALGIQGAAWANVTATWLGTAFYFGQAWFRARPNGFMRAMPQLRTMATMLKASLPAALQQLLFALGMVVFFAIVKPLGTSAVAVCGVLVQLLLVALLPAIGFGIAAASLVGQALGRKDPDDARRWGWDVVRVGVPIVTAIAMLGLLFPDYILSAFLAEEATRALGRWPLRMLAIALPIDATGMILLNSLLGAGDSVRVLVIATGLQWLVFLPAAYLIGPELGYGLTAIWIVNAIYRLLQSGIFAVIWRGSAWTKIKL
jgi:MATE family multidrug resistance protein